MKIIGLIGYPLGHSFSKQYFTGKFIRKKLLDHSYNNFEIDDIRFITGIINNNVDLIGFNVTIPYKKKIIPYLDILDDSAKRTGSVNCVKINRTKSGKQLIGYNTDIYGFEQSLKPLIKSHHNKSLILGSGGSSLSVEYVLNDIGIKTTIVSRKKADLNITYEELESHIIKENTLIINTTPLGMSPNTELFPDINYSALTSNHLLYDLIYNPSETMFLKKGKKAGAIIKNGMEMLHLQADKSLEIFLA